MYKQLYVLVLKSAGVISILKTGADWIFPEIRSKLTKWWLFKEKKILKLEEIEQNGRNLGITFIL